MTVLMLRADASAAIGVGHVMRCLALGQAWIAAGGRASLASVDLAPRLEERFARAGVTVCRLDGKADSADSAAAAAAACDARVVVVDAPSLGGDVQARARAQGAVVGVIDDAAEAASFSADVLINQNVYADAKAYAERAPGAITLCGPAYVMLREEFRAAPLTNRRIAPRAERLLVTFGGADPGGLTEATVHALIAAGATRRMALTVVAGPANPRADAIRRALGKAGELLVDPGSMLALMRHADLAITSGGGTVYEMARLGLPMIIGAATPMEARAGETITAAGAARYAGALEDDLPTRLATLAVQLADDGPARAGLAERASTLVDGQGAARVVAALMAVVASRRRAA